MGASVSSVVEDGELHRRACGGDRQAFAELIRRHHKQLFGLCRRITCDEYDAQDALQEALILVWRSLSTFDGQSRVGSWLYRIVINAAIDEVRRRKRRAAPTDEVPDRPHERSEDDGVAARLDVDRALSRIPPPFRAVLVLRELYGLSYREIAEVRELPIDTVKTQIWRGRQALARELGAPARAGRSAARSGASA